MVRRSVIVEGLFALLQEEEPGELYMHTRVQGNKEHGSAGKRNENKQRTAESAELKHAAGMQSHAECECECERTASYFRRERNENTRVIPAIPVRVQGNSNVPDVWVNCSNT